MWSTFGFFPQYFRETKCVGLCRQSHIHWSTTKKKLQKKLPDNNSLVLAINLQLKNSLFNIIILNQSKPELAWSITCRQPILHICLQHIRIACHFANLYGDLKSVRRGIILKLSFRYNNLTAQFYLNANKVTKRL